MDSSGLGSLCGYIDYLLIAEYSPGCDILHFGYMLSPLQYEFSQKLISVITDMVFLFFFLFFFLIEYKIIFFLFLQSPFVLGLKEIKLFLFLG